VQLGRQSPILEEMSRHAFRIVFVGKISPLGPGQAAQCCAILSTRRDGFRSRRTPVSVVREFSGFGWQDGADHAALETIARMGRVGNCSP
jgi:hypothetical protein